MAASPRSRLSLSLKAQAIELNKKGVAICDIAHGAGYHSTTVRAWFTKAGLVPTHVLAGTWAIGNPKVVRMFLAWAKLCRQTTGKDEYEPPADILQSLRIVPLSEEDFDGHDAAKPSMPIESIPEASSAPVKEVELEKTKDRNNTPKSDAVEKAREEINEALAKGGTSVQEYLSLLSDQNVTLEERYQAVVGTHLLHRLEQVVSSQMPAVRSMGDLEKMVNILRKTLGLDNKVNAGNSGRIQIDLNVLSGGKRTTAHVVDAEIAAEKTPYGRLVSNAQDED